MMEGEDEAVVRRCLKGEVGAFGELVEKYQKPVYNLALRLVRNEAEAEDVAQTAFIKAYENLSSFKPGSRFFSWLYKIAANEAMNAIRRLRRFEPLSNGNGAAADEGGLEATERLDEEARILDALMDLTMDHRAVIVLKHLQELSYEEVGQVLDISTKKVKSRLFSARQELRTALRKRGVSEQ
jgi:RNA polymerase sigma-70 factor (ECF subfamily)